MQRPVECLPRLLTASELADQIGISKFRLYELCREGAIPHIRLGRSVRFDPHTVLAWLHGGGTSEGGEEAA